MNNMMVSFNGIIKGMDDLAFMLILLLPMAVIASICMVCGLNNAFRVRYNEKDTISFKKMCIFISSGVCIYFAFFFLIVLHTS